MQPIVCSKIPTATTTTARVRAAGHGRRRHSRAAGFSLIELLVVMFVLVLLIGMLLPAVARARRSANAVNCVSNLRQITVAFHQYANNNRGRLPDPPAADISWEAALLKYGCASGIYRCPADGELAASLGSSYDWRDTGDPLTTLAGCPITDARNATVLVYDALPNWHAKLQVNVAHVDGSAGPVPMVDCVRNLMTPLRYVDDGGSADGAARGGR
jgi:type II secretory pathway pseudopilin PulG